jgi:hypothetical protein
VNEVTGYLGRPTFSSSECYLHRKVLTSQASVGTTSEIIAESRELRNIHTLSVFLALEGKRFSKTKLSSAVSGVSLQC